MAVKRQSAMIIILIANLLLTLVVIIMFLKSSYNNIIVFNYTTTYTTRPTQNGPLLARKTDTNKHEQPYKEKMYISSDSAVTEHIINDIVINNNSTEHLDDELNGFNPNETSINFNYGAGRNKTFGNQGTGVTYMNITQLKLEIRKYDEWKMNFEYGVIWSFDKENQTKVAVLLIYISTKTDKFFISDDPLSDARYKYFKLLNALNYGYTHQYDVIFVTKPMYEYISNDQDYSNYMNSPHWQKPFALKLLFTDLSYEYEWIFYTDFDALFINCSSPISYFIEQAYSNPNVINKESVSFIFAGDNHIFLNSGIFIIRNNEWSLNLLNDMIYTIENAELYKWDLIRHNTLKEQNVFCALIQGWNITDIDHDHIQKKVKSMKVPQNNGVTDEEYLNCVNNDYMKQFAIPIERYLFNIKAGEWFKSRLSKRRRMSIIHFMGQKATKHNYHTFHIFSLADKHCKIAV